MSTDAMEEALLFACRGETLVGIVNIPSVPDPHGVLIVVGGPQYRAGSHRQFTLLARYLGQEGIASFRFDYRGMGDSTGTARTFEGAQDDIRGAIDSFVARVPALKAVVIWGLCDAASAALFYAQNDARVSGLVLLNPWVRTEQGVARARLRHYYVARLLQGSFWRKLGRGEFDPRLAASSLAGFLRDALKKTRRGGASQLPLPQRMEQGLRNFGGKVLLILSGTDLTAQEFKDVAGASRGWRSLLEDQRVTRNEIADANHTFARREWRDQVAQWTAEWVKRLEHPAR
jgi:exosortase A-associated hydrolase 1